MYWSHRIQRFPGIAYGPFPLRALKQKLDELDVHNRLLVLKGGTHGVQ